jgi:hypothetical protein
VKQLYATGQAAELVTQNEPLKPPEKDPPDSLEGHRRPFFFGTGTNFGLKVGFTGETPSSVKIGFNREELSIIPMQEGDPTKDKPDKYASVLAAINMDDTTIASTSGTHVRPRQFFATGAAARNLAKREDIRGMFGDQAASAVAASVQATVAATTAQRQTDYNSIVAYFNNVPANGFATARDKLLADAGLANDPLYGPVLKLKSTPTDFLAYVKGNAGLIGTLALSAVKLSGQQ